MEGFSCPLLLFLRFLLSAEFFKELFSSFSFCLSLSFYIFVTLEIQKREQGKIEQINMKQ